MDLDIFLKSKYYNYFEYIVKFESKNFKSYSKFFKFNEKENKFIKEFVLDLPLFDKTDKKQYISHKFATLLNTESGFIFLYLVIIYKTSKSTYKHYLLNCTPSNKKCPYIKDIQKFPLKLLKHHTYNIDNLFLTDGPTLTYQYHNQINIFRNSSSSTFNTANLLKLSTPLPILSDTEVEFIAIESSLEAPTTTKPLATPSKFVKATFNISLSSFLTTNLNFPHSFTSSTLSLYIIDEPSFTIKTPNITSQILSDITTQDDTPPTSPTDILILTTFHQLIWFKNSQIHKFLTDLPSHGSKFSIIPSSYFGGHFNYCSSLPHGYHLEDKSINRGCYEDKMEKKECTHVVVISSAIDCCFITFPGFHVIIIIIFKFIISNNFLMSIYGRTLVNLIIYVNIC